MTATSERASLSDFSTSPILRYLRKIPYFRSRELLRDALLALLTLAALWWELSGIR